jgi:sugar/nucleoside kinase (ribokinase family)
MKILNNNSEYDVLGMGSALLDLIVKVDNAELDKFGLKKSGMQLIDDKRSREILSALEGRAVEKSPGGSSANTLAGISNLGGKGIFFGKVGNDVDGDLYIQDTERAGVKPLIGRHNSMTGHAITLITPDSERTFATHLGAALQFSRDDIHEEYIKNSKIIHIEGYLFEPPGLREACMKALEIAKRNNVLISIDLSDPGLIDRIYDTFKHVVHTYANIVFVNEDEARAFTSKNKEHALNDLCDLCDFAVVKLGSEGSIIKSGGKVYRIPVYKTDVVNTNGAGDMYAAGVLYSIARGYGPELSGKIGSYVSSKVVSQVGARLPGKISLEGIV